MHQDHSWLRRKIRKHRRRRNLWLGMAAFYTVLAITNGWFLMGPFVFPIFAFFHNRAAQELSEKLIELEGPRARLLS